MSAHHDYDPSHYQVFSPYGPFKSNYHGTAPQNALIESHQLQTFTCDQEGASSSSSGQRHTSNTPSTRNAMTVEYASCNCSKTCYHIQRLFLTTAVLTGLAFIIVGATQDSKNGDHQVFVNIGIILVGVGVVLLLIQWQAQRKLRKRRNRTLSGNSNVKQPPDSLPGQILHQPLIEGTNNVIVSNASSAGYFQHAGQISPSDVRSIISQQLMPTNFHEQHHHHPKSHSSHHLPRYDVYRSQAVGGYHDLAHSVPSPGAQSELRDRV